VSASTDGLSPRAAVSQMATGYWISQAVRAMAILGLADHLASGPRTATNLAEERPARTPRVLRASCGPWSPSVCAGATTLDGST
jgi:hypothetical protein